MRAPGRFSRQVIRSVASALARRGDDAALLVLIFHRVLPEHDPLLPHEPDANVFAAQMDLLRTCFSVLPLAEGHRRLRDGSLPPRAACITFDDGYANNCDIALPILSSRGLPATVFVAPGFLDGGRMFNDTVIETVRRAPEDFDLRSEGLDRYRLTDAAARSQAVDSLLAHLKYLETAERLRRIERLAAMTGATLPTDLMMTRDQVRHLHRSGIEIGAHTMDHPILTSVDDDTARRQIADSKAELERIVGAPVRSFAYPNGRPQRDYAARHAAMARETGFDVALSTAWGSATRASDPFQIPRVAAWDRDPLRYGLRLARAYGDRVSAVA